MGISDHGLLLDVPNQPMAKLGTDYIGEEEQVVEDRLCSNDGAAEDHAGVLELNEGQEVHPLILGLFEEGMDPTWQVTKAW